jgi:hypothetical protein
MSMNLNFRPLRADEVEARIAIVKENGLSLLLYKDARCDMNLLDETVGPMNWQKSYSRENANCSVSIWDEDKQQWISKEDTGTESFTEKEKGLASDSFKRACFNWGIGRELYTAPSVFINLENGEWYEDKGKTKVSNYTKFHVGFIAYDEERREITEVKVLDKEGRCRFAWSKSEHERAVLEAKAALQQQKDAQEDAERRMKVAVEEIMAAENRDQLNDIWNKYKEFQTKGSDFYNAAAERGKQLKTAKK